MEEPGKNCLHGEKSYHLSEISPALRSDKFILIYTICFYKVNLQSCWDLTQVRCPTQVGFLNSSKQPLKILTWNLPYIMPSFCWKLSWKENYYKWSCNSFSYDQHWMESLAQKYPIKSPLKLAFWKITNISGWNA